MADPTNSADPRRAATRRRTAIAFGAISIVGFLLGALVNVGLARVLALTANADDPAFVDADAGEAGDNGERVTGGDVAAGEEPAAEPVARGPRALPKKTYADIIVRRNIFDSTAVYDPN